MTQTLWPVKPGLFVIWPHTGHVLSQCPPRSPSTPGAEGMSVSPFAGEAGKAPAEESLRILKKPHPSLAHLAQEIASDIS